MPGLRHIAAVANSNTTAPRQLQALQDAARARGVELSIYGVAKPNEIAAAIDAAKKADAAALNVLASPFLFADRQVIMERATGYTYSRQYTNGRKLQSREASWVRSAPCPDLPRNTSPADGCAAARHQTGRSAGRAAD